ncbi:nitrous oxide reductase accessory protein NosL [Candidatus Sulfurimonas baltica]|nr:nitrous oxide reductase accessory protein NosL [Candidatus Sulfurimonas baltica]
MMRKMIPYSAVIVLVLIIVTLFLSLASTKKMVVIIEGNTNQIPIEMKIGVFQDSDCGMVINDLRDASQVISKNAKSWFFHDHGGMIKWLEDKEFKSDAKIWVMSRDTKKWIDARTAYYSLIDDTPMGYGFGAYEFKKDLHVDFDTMRLRMLRGETLKNPRIKKQLLGN